MDFLNISIGFYYSLKKSQISNSNEFPLGKTSNLKEILLRPDTARISLFFTEVEFNCGSFLSSYFFHSLELFMSSVVLILSRKSVPL